MLEPMNRRWLTVAAGIGTLTAFGAGGVLLRAPSGHGPVTVEARPDRPDLVVDELETRPPRTTRLGAEVFGVNEGLSLPQHGLTRAMSPSDRRTLQTRAQLLDQLGTSWVRVNSHGFGGLNMMQVQDDWADSDALLSEIGVAGFSAVVVIGPWPGTKTGNYTSRYLPEDLDAYAAWVEATTRRYQGEGWPEIVWEVDNEPDLHNSEPPRGAKTKVKPGSFETPAEYATVLLVTAAAIRRADPDALVLSGGMYRAMTPKGRTYLERTLEQPGVRDAIDGISLHCYFAESELDPLYRLMAVSRQVAPDKPVWITETSVPSDAARAEIASEQWQAEMVVAIHGALLAEGADHIFWHTLFDAPAPVGGGPSGMRTNSLYRLVGDGVSHIEAKPSAETYRRLAHHLADQPLDTMQPEEGFLRFRDGVLVYEGVIETPADITTVEDLRTGEQRGATEQIEAPAWAF
ncbi:MAG TPA: hypothetical protein QGF58_07340 [Myxococcota bacterium]|nr:hypothetical protein [Myxococcota bacterium]